MQLSYIVIWLCVTHKFAKTEIHDYFFMLIIHEITLYSLNIVITINRIRFWSCRVTTQWHTSAFHCYCYSQCQFFISYNPKSRQVLRCKRRNIFDIRFWIRFFCTSVNLSMTLVIQLSFSELSILEDNKRLENILSEFQMPTMKYGTLKIAGYGETILYISICLFFPHIEKNI